MSEMKSPSVELMEIPAPLLTLLKKFRVTRPDAGLAEGQSLADIVAVSKQAIPKEAAAKARAQMLLAKEILKRAMLEDKVPHVLRTMLGGIKKDGNGDPLTIYQSRWILPEYHKSISESAKDAPTDYHFKWLEENWDLVFKHLQFFPTDVRYVGEHLSLTADGIKEALSTSSPRRAQSLVWLQEVYEKADGELTKAIDLLFPKAKAEKESKKEGKGKGKEQESPEPKVETEKPEVNTEE